MSRSLRILVVVVVLVLAAVIGFIARQTMEGNASAPFGAGQVASQAASEVFELSGQKFERWVKPRDVPDLRFSDPAGRPTSLSKFQGRMILLNLWATWCPPCREEMPALDRLNARLDGDRFTVVTLALDSPDKADAFLRQIKATTLQNYTDTHECSEADHHDMAAYHQARAAKLRTIWNAVLERAMIETFNRPFQFTDYKVSGICRDEFHDRRKRVLRHCIHRADEHDDMARAHTLLARRLRQKDRRK